MRFKLGSVWEADADASGSVTTFVIVRAEGEKRVALALQGGGVFVEAQRLFYFHVDWPFCSKCVRVA